MYRSPPNLRSGHKVKAVALSSGEHQKVQRSLSAPSPSAASPSSSKTTMPLANNAAIDPALLAAVEAAVEKAVKSAVQAALASFNEKISKLQEEVDGLQKKVKEIDGKLTERTDELEQYQRRNNIRIFGVKETAGEDTDKIVAELCQDKLGIQLPPDAISRSHRVGKRQEPGADGRERHRPIIVRFVSYRARRTVFQSKKKLKGTGVTIREDLTRLRQTVYKQAVAQFGTKNVWTHDGRVLWVDGGGKNGVATRLVDLPTEA